MRLEIRSTINEMVDDKLRQIKEEKQLRNDFGNRKLELIALSEAEVLENYNRRENFRIWIFRKAIRTDKGNLTSKQQRLS